MSDTRTETRGARSIPADKLAALYEAERERDSLRQLVNEGTMPFVRSQATLRARAEKLEDVLRDLVDHADQHRLSYESHDHDCYQEWALLRDEARLLLPEPSAQE